MVGRRQFLKNTGLVALSLGNPIVPWAFQALMNSATARAESSENAFVFVFLRGGADGLSILSPTPEHSQRALYEAARPNIKLDLSDMTPLGNTGFGLNNACPNFFTLFQSERASFFHGVGNKSSDSRSHFIQQDFVDQGGAGSDSSGFLNRALAGANPYGANLVASSAGPNISKALLGNRASSNNLIVPVHNLDSSSEGNGFSLANNQFSRHGSFLLGMGLTERILASWTQTPGSLGNKATRASQALIQAMERVKNVSFGDYGKLPQFKTAAQLLIGCPTLRFLTVDVEGWDTHDLMGPKEGGYFYKLLNNFDQSLGTFLKDIAGKRDNVHIVIVSEFGRPLQENGTLGLDHGRGGLAITIGPKGEGGKVNVKPEWSLRQDKLEEGRDITVTTDHREILASILKRSNPALGSQLSQIFPNFKLG